MIGIIGAMHEEVDELIKDMVNVDKKQIASIAFYTGKLNNTEIVIASSGIGKVNMAICAQCMIDNFNPTLLINTGIAGGLDKSLSIGDIVISIDAVEHDMNVVELGFDRGIIPNMETSIFKADKTTVDKLYEVSNDLFKGQDIHILKGRVCSGDLFISSKKQKDNIVYMFNGACAEMEGAALAHTAHLNNIPFAILRSISDKADGEAVVDYPSFKNLAIKRSVDLIKAFCR